MNADDKKLTRSDRSKPTGQKRNFRHDGKSGRTVRHSPDSAAPRAKDKVWHKEKPQRKPLHDRKPAERIEKAGNVTEPLSEPIVTIDEFPERPHEVYDPVRVLRDGTQQKLLSLLGFAARGRKLIAGTDLCRDSIRRGAAILTLVVSDASANTKKRIIDACKYFRSDMCVIPLTSAELSHQIGKTGEIMVVSITDIHFADGIAALFEDREPKAPVSSGKN